ncbi:MAG: hypothetical protein ACR2NU_11720, partial [Aeoliella sp.]
MAGSKNGRVARYEPLAARLMLHGDGVEVFGGLDLSHLDSPTDTSQADSIGATYSASLQHELSAAIQAHNPHADDPVRREEHLAVLELVQAADATHRAINSGDWLDPSVWANGAAPGDGA